MTACSSYPCQNGGSCFLVGQKYNCSCSNGYRGSNCESKSFGSSFLTDAQTTQLFSLIGFSSSSFSSKPIYQASKDGFSASNFHSKCDNAPNTLVIIKTVNNNIFGAYVEVSWSGSGSYKSDSNAFLFSLVNPSNNPIKMPVHQYPQYAIYATPSYGPTFGGGHDLHTPDSPNSNQGYLNLGHSYKVPNYITYGSSAQSYLDGAYNFKVSEIEVFVRNS